MSAEYSHLVAAFNLFTIFAGVAAACFAAFIRQDCVRKQRQYPDHAHYWISAKRWCIAAFCAGLLAVGIGFYRLLTT